MKGLEVRARWQLREVDVGEWTGLTWAEIEQRFPGGIARHHERGHGWEQGESYEAMAERVLAELGRIAEEHPGGTVLVVAHGGTMRAIAAHADGVDVATHRRRNSTPVRNCELRILAIENGRLRRLN